MPAMNKKWSDFLQSRPVSQDASQPECALNDLSHFGLIRVEGEDVMQFLQGQMTNDMREVTDQHSNLSGWCNAKGRMTANFRVFRQGDAYILQAPDAHIEPVIKKLRMYVLMAKVSLDVVSDQLARFGISGECSIELLRQHFRAPPEEANAVVAHNKMLLIRLPGTTPRFELIGPVAELIEVWETCEAKAVRKGEAFWALQEVRAGIPTVLPETTDAFVPQMANMQLIDGVSFTKGCYIGQEVVARMQYLGKLKRRMYLAHVKSANAPRPGDELFAKDSKSGQGTGKVVDAQPTGDGYDMLAVIEIASAEIGEVYLGAGGAKLELLDLPYEFTSESL